MNRREPVTLHGWLLHYPHVAMGAMVAVLYLSDCLVLSSARNVLGTSAANGRIQSLISPGRVVIVRGKVLYVLPPLSPWRPVHRIALAGGTDGPPPLVAVSTVRATQGAALLMIVATACLIVLGAQPNATLSCIAGLYAAGMLTALFLRRRLGSVGWLRVAQCTLCPPCALNLLRRHTLALAPSALTRAVGPMHDQLALQRMRESVAPLRDVLDHPLPPPLNPVAPAGEARGPGPA